MRSSVIILILILLFGVDQTFAKAPISSSQSWMAAKSASEMKNLVGAQEQQKTFSQRCRAELKGSYLPLHCYRWLEKSALQAGARSYMQKTLDEVCEKRLGEGIVIGDKMLELASHLGSKCQKALKAWISIKMYKMNRENTEKLFGKMGTGSIFESVLDNANTESVSQDRVHNPRSARGGLN